MISFIASHEEQASAKSAFVEIFQMEGCNLNLINKDYMHKNSFFMHILLRK